MSLLICAIVVTGYAISIPVRRTLSSLGWI